MKREEIKTYKDACKVRRWKLHNKKTFKELLQDWFWGD